MTKYTRCLIILGIVGVLLISGCSTQIQAPETHDIAPRDEAVHISRTVVNMDDIAIIKRTTDYLKAMGESAVFNETYMVLHYELDEPAVLTVQDGSYIEYGGDYLEVRFYRNREDEGDICEECYVVYMALNGSILGYAQPFALD